MSTDLTTQYAVPTVPSSQNSFREIRFAGSSMSDTKIEDEHLYIAGYGGAEDEDLGTEIDCIVLRQAMKSRGQFNDDDPNNRHYMYDSSEFNTFGDVVVLYDTHSIPTRILAALPYSHKNPNLPSIGGKSERALSKKVSLSLRYVYYIVYKDEIFRLNGGSTDFTGADENDKPLGFNSPDEGSFMDFLSSLEGDPVFTHHCKLSAKKHSKKITLKKFKKGKKVSEEDMKTVSDKLAELYDGLNDAHWLKFGKALENTDVKSLDEWSQKILGIIEDKTFDALLRGHASEMFKVSLDSLPDVIDVKVIEAPDTVSDTEKNVEDVAKGLTESMMDGKPKIEEIPF